MVRLNHESAAAEPWTESASTISAAKAYTPVAIGGGVGVYY